MWWNVFKRHFADTVNTYALHESCNVHSDNQEIHILNRKVNVDFLQYTKSSIKIELAKTPVTLNYDDTLTEFRTQVNRNFPSKI